MSERALNIPTAPVFLPLCTEDARYLAAHGGRGSGKTLYFAGRVVEKCVANPGTHGVCIREIQKSLAQSAKRAIEEMARKYEVGGMFDPRRDVVTTPGGGLLLFQGMQNHTADSIKSLEGYDFAWAEEAHTLSAHSLRILRPTLRKAGSQLWFSWNPEKPSDPVDHFFRGNDPEAKDKWAPPPRSVIVEANWWHNPWFGETELTEEKDYDRRRDIDTYDHVWRGGYRQQSEARVFKNWRVEWFEPPDASVRLLAGADWGFSQDPTTLVICFIVGRTLYVWREVYRIGVEIDRIPAFFDKIDPQWTQERSTDPHWKSLARKIGIRADSARPDTISYLQRSGFPQIVPAIKGVGSVEDGIEFLKSYDIVVHPDCVHTTRELMRYSYKVDKKTDKITSELVDTENHIIDPLRYAVEIVRHAKQSRRDELRI